MPKKKAARPAKAKVVKKAVKPVKAARKSRPPVRAKMKAAPVRRPVARKAAPAPAKPAPTKRAPTKPAPEAKSAPAMKITPAAIDPQRPESSLGRPLVTQEEKLYMLFHDDYQSRQVFEFLRVETVKELEQFTPQQIVHLMSRPIRLTVERIRQRLAQFKRSLKDDEQFAAEFRQSGQAVPAFQAAPR